MKNVLSLLSVLAILACSAISFAEEEAVPADAAATTEASADAAAPVAEEAKK
jgi:hypothetical protein